MWNLEKESVKKKSRSAKIRTQDLRRVKAETCNVCTVIDEPNAVDLSFSLNEESNHQNTIHKKKSLDKAQIINVPYEFLTT